MQTMQQPVDWSMALIRAEAPVPIQSILRPLSWEETELWVRPEKLDVRGGIPRDQMLPQAVGHCWQKEEGEREVVYGMNGPGRWPLAEESGRLEDMVVFDRAGPPGCLRRVTPEELWRMQGRTVVELKEAMKKFRKTEAEMVYEGTRATGVHTATNLLSVVGYIVVCMQAQDRKAGMGRDEEGARAIWPRSYYAFAGGREAK